MAFLFEVVDTVTQEEFLWSESWWEKCNPWEMNPMSSDQKFHTGYCGVSLSFLFWFVRIWRKNPCLGGDCRFYQPPYFVDGADWDATRILNRYETTSLPTKWWSITSTTQLQPFFSELFGVYKFVDPHYLNMKIPMRKSGCFLPWNHFSTDFGWFCPPPI